MALFSFKEDLSGKGKNAIFYAPENRKKELFLPTNLVRLCRANDQFYCNANPKECFIGINFPYPEKVATKFGQFGNA